MPATAAVAHVLSGELSPRTGVLSTDDIACGVIAAKRFDIEDAILRAAIREQVGSTVKRLHRNGAVENIDTGRASKWRVATG
jgi:hypothetical protein